MPIWESQFILKHGSSFHTIANSKPYLYVSGGSMDIALIATYYAFHWIYAMEVLTTLLLIQSEVLGETIVTPKSQVHVCPTIVENFNFPFDLIGL